MSTISFLVYTQQAAAMAMIAINENGCINGNDYSRSDWAPAMAMANTRHMPLGTSIP